MSAISDPQPPPDDVYDRAIDLRQIAQAFRRHSLWVIVAALTGAAAGFVASKLQPPIVVASARLYVQQLADAPVTTDTQALYASFVDDPEIVGRVLDETGLHEAPHLLTRPMLEAAISHRPGLDGRSIFVDVRLGDPESAKLIAKTMARHVAEATSRRDLEADQAGIRAAMENLDAATEQFNRAAEALDAFQKKEPEALAAMPPPPALQELRGELGQAEKLRRRYQNATDRAVKFSLQPRYAVRYVDVPVETRVVSVTAQYAREGAALAIILAAIVMYLRGLKTAL